MCHYDYKNCSPFEIHLLIIEKQDSFLTVDFRVIENGILHNEIINIDTTMWKASQYSETIKPHVEIFEEGITSWSNVANQENSKVFDEIWFQTQLIG